MATNYSYFMHDANYILGMQYKRLGATPLSIVSVNYNFMNQYKIEFSRDLTPRDVSNVLMQIFSDELYEFRYNPATISDTGDYNRAYISIYNVSDFLANK